jgi:hypothetical protein
MGNVTSESNSCQFIVDSSESSNILLNSTPELMNTIREYYQLRSLPNLSEQQEDRVGEILELATTNRVVDFWITEVDHALGHRLGLLDESCRQSYQNQQALLREYPEMNDICDRQYPKSSGTLRENCSFR